VSPRWLSRRMLQLVGELYSQYSFVEAEPIIAHVDIPVNNTAVVLRCNCAMDMDTHTAAAEVAPESIVVLKATVDVTLPYNNNEKVLVQIPDNGNCAAQSVYVSVFGKLPSATMLQKIATTSVAFFQSDMCKNKVEGLGDMSLIDFIQQGLQRDPVLVTAVTMSLDGSLIIQDPTTVYHDGPVPMTLNMEQYYKLLEHPRNMFANLELGLGYYYATIFKKPVHVHMLKISDICTHTEGAYVGKRTCQLLQYEHVATYLPFKAALQQEFEMYVPGESYSKDDICLVQQDGNHFNCMYKPSLIPPLLLAVNEDVAVAANPAPMHNVILQEGGVETFLATAPPSIIATAPVLKKVVKFKADYHWRRRLYRRWRVTTRKRTNQKSLDINIRISKWQVHHGKLRVYMQSGIPQCPKYGLFAPHNRYNFDQVPMPFEFYGDSTIESVGTRTVAIKGCSSVDGEKRMATAQLCIRAVKNGESQPRLALIFRGKGHFLKKERKLYDPRVDVFANDKAWATRKFSDEWAMTTLKKHIDERTAAEGVCPSTIGFCDNLDSHTQPEFRDALGSFGMNRSLLVAGETECLQAIDGGVGSTFKMIVGQIQDEWLDGDGNLDAWEGCPHAAFKIDAKMRRILITQWSGEAWERLTTDDRYKETFYKCFQRTGCLITADGSDDHEIIPMQGMKGYIVPIYVPPVVISAPLHTMGEVVRGGEGDDEVGERLVQGMGGREGQQGGEGQRTAGAEGEGEQLGEGQAQGEELLVADGLGGFVASAVDTGEDDDFIEKDDEIDIDLDVEAPEDDLDEENNHEDGSDSAEADEEESWAMALDSAASLLDVAIKPAVDDVRLPKRLTGSYAFIFIEGEWELAKIEILVKDKLYRYKLTASWDYGIFDFSLECHGRRSESPKRWVLCVM